MNMISSIIISSVKSALAKLNLSDVDIHLEHPADFLHGDYASNIALAIFSEIRNSKFEARNKSKAQIFKFKNPRELAQVIVDELKKNKELSNIVSKIEVAGPGFINFWLANDYLADIVDRITEKGNTFGVSDDLKGKKVIVEYTDPNPFKEFHIGHLFSNIIGESLAKLYEARGAVVKRANYQGDVGMHVAKAVWGMQKKEKDKHIKLSTLEKKTLSDRVVFMGASYALGATAYEKDKKSKKEIQDLNKKIYEKDKSVYQLYAKGRKWSLEYFETIYKQLGTKFDYYFFESETGEQGKIIVENHMNVFEKSDGAIIFNGEKHGLHTRVFINSLGIPTYEAKDLGLVITKYNKYPYDQSIIVTGNEIVDYFKVVLKALEQINPDLREKTKHVSHGMVRIKGGKLSSRTGDILRGGWLIDEAKKKAHKLGNDSSDHVAELVGLSAVKYSLLQSNIGRDIIFDLDTSVSLEGNSGPYLLYTYARTQSVLRKSEIRISNLETNSKLQFKFQNLELTGEEQYILRTLYKFSEVVHEAGKAFAPSVIANYLYDLAQKYNLFYQKVPILKSNDSERQFRLTLTQATGHILKNGLSLLGIQTLEKM